MLTVSTRRILRRQRLIYGVVAVVFVAVVLIILWPRITSPIDSYAACVNAGYPVLETEPPVCREGSHSFVGTPGATSTSRPPVTSLAFDILVNGDTHTKVPLHHQDYIKSEAEWETYWRSVHNGLVTQPPLLPVDFARYSVVGASLGEQSTSGFVLKITAITTSATGTTVSITESAPTITCSVAMQSSNPYAIVRTPKLTEPVNFRVTQDKHHC